MEKDTTQIRNPPKRKTKESDKEIDRSIETDADMIKRNSFSQKSCFAFRCCLRENKHVVTHQTRVKRDKAGRNEIQT